MDGVLSQEEINALLNEPGAEASDSAENELSDAQKDAIGEIANISMGTAATTLFSLVNHKVEISTPVVSYGTWDDIVQEYEKPCVFIRIAYTVGLDGSNILVLREHDVKVITDLMMGGDGTNTDGELGELHLSAISEAMNQMMGSAATSLSSMLNRKIDISPPNATVINLQEDIDEAEIDSFLTGKFVKISFRMEIGDLVDSTIMQLYPISFAKDMCDGVAKTMEMDSQSVTADSSAANSGNPAGTQPAAAAAAQQSQQMASQNTAQMGQPMGQPMGQTMMQNGSSIMPGKVNPVIPEVVSQVAFHIIGHDTTITMAAEAGQMELNAFEPVVFYNLFDSITTLTHAVDTLTANCILGITANEKRCRELLDASVGITTALCPYIGYKKAASLAKESLKTDIPVKTLVLKYGLLKESELDSILDPYAMTEARTRQTQAKAV